MMRFRVIKIILSLIFLIVFFNKKYHSANSLTIDNTLVAGGEDCFERIALGAMLPLDKTFRTEDINSEKKCKELCLSIGEKCQTISFGLSIRGNGTCQISSEKIEVVGSRPIGTIFDPNFDLFLRKTNCLSLPTGGTDVPSPITPIDSNRPTTGFGTSSFASDTTAFAGSTFGTDPTPEIYSPPLNRPSTLPTDPTDTRYPSTGPGYLTTNIDNTMGTTYVIHDNTPETSFGTRPRPTPSYPTTQYGGFTTQYGSDRITYSEGNPLYPNPTLYEYPTNRPASYAPNIPTVDDRYNQYGSVTQRVTTPRPMYGSGYGNGYSYGTPDPNRRRRPDKNGYYPGPPTTYDSSDYDRTRYPTTRPDYNTTPEKERPDYNHSNNGNGYDNRPDPPYSGGMPNNNGHPNQNGYDNRRDPERRPDDRNPPTYNGNGNNGNNNGHNGYDNRPSTGKKPEYDDRPGYDNRWPGDRDSRPYDKKPGYDNRPDPGYGRPEYNGNPNYNTGSPNYDRPGYDYNQRPQRPGYETSPTNGPSYNGHDVPGYDNNQRPQRPGYEAPPTNGPSYNDQDRPGYNNNQRPQRPGYETPPTNGPSYNGYKPTDPLNNNRNPTTTRRPYADSHPTETSNDNTTSINGQGNGYNNRPDPGYIGRPNGHNGYSGQGNDYGNGPTKPIVPSSSNGDYGGNWNGYRPHANRTRPGFPKPNDSHSHDYASRPEVKPAGYGERHDIGYYDGDYNSEHRFQFMEYNGACFRRVLAGKRVAPHWVRRTIACERVEDCMQECGHEKRFQCEGFNYRLDPSGHGQGDCELIEVPLAQMDLYSSAQHRDANLLRHPDYDYYERDRNAPSSCRTACKDCGSGKPISSQAIYFRPGSHDRPPSYHHDDRFPPSSSGYGGPPLPPPDHYNRPPTTAVDRYRPIQYESRPDEYHRYDFQTHGYHESSGSGGYYRPSSSSGYGGDRVDRYDEIRPSDEAYRPSHWETIPSSHGGSSYGGDFSSRPDADRPDNFRPPYRPGPDYSPYRNPPHAPPLSRPDAHYIPSPPPSSHGYLERDRHLDYNKKPPKFIPYLIGVEKEYDNTGYGYGGSTPNKNADYWGVANDNRRKDGPDFNYFELGGRRPLHVTDNSIYTYPGSKYQDKIKTDYDYGSQWTRRAGIDECSVKTCEGFRLHKGAIRHAYHVPSVTECEKLCFSEDKFNCHTYSFRYSSVGRDNCLLCDRPVNLLDYYVDLEPDRDYDIYSMSDEHKSCRAPPSPPPTQSHGPLPSPSTALSDPRNNQCFFRAIDATRFFKTIVRDSLTVRSIGECELECIKSSKFTCRAFAFRYGQKERDSIIDNCQLSDWPVRDMDKTRHLKLDPSFDVFERASYGHGCEIQPIVDDKHKKLCYLGYGSAAKLLSPAIKKVISVPTELECKRECIRYREKTSFKCYSFSYGAHASSYNCEMSDLDQSELKLNIHYAHTPDRDYWLFAWNPFDWTCRDKVATIGGNRVNNDRRMDIFREPGDVTWRHYTVSGKPCRIGSGCDKNLVTGFYSCEIDGGEIGSWDYCCKAEYPCGYSQGFDYPWCFVGDEPDQWRKCSDRYFPGNHTHAGITIPPSKDKTKKPTAYLPTESTHSSEHSQQRPPRPGGLQSLTDFTAARLWPVTYLYSEGPPNSTELSNFVDCNKETC